MQLLHRHAVLVSPGRAEMISDPPASSILSLLVDLCDGRRFCCLRFLSPADKGRWHVLVKYPIVLLVDWYAGHLQPLDAVQELTGL